MNDKLAVKFVYTGFESKANQRRTRVVFLETGV